MPAKTRLLKIRPHRLQADIDAQGKKNVASALGVHLTTLNSLINDSWERIERDTIERLCDHLNCELDEVFFLEPSRFWDPFIEASTYRILRGVITQKTVKAPLEEQAKASVTSFLQGHLPDISGGFAGDHLRTDQQFIDYARNNNCIVIGAHESNLAYEKLVSRFFDAKPNDPSPDNRRKIPFRLVKPDSPARSTVLESRRNNRRSSTGLGVYSEEHQRLIVEVNRWPKEEYLAMKIPKAHDAAIILVANKPFGTDKNVKLIVLAGFSKIGTLAAAEALAADYRDLEPVQEDGYTVGVIDVLYKKTSEGDNRDVLRHEWKVRKGGRRDIPYTEGSPTRRERSKLSE